MTRALTQNDHVQDCSERIGYQTVCLTGEEGGGRMAIPQGFSGGESIHSTGIDPLFCVSNGPMQVNAVVRCTNTRIRIIVNRYVKLCAKVVGRGGGWMATLRGFGGRGIDPLNCHELLLEQQVSLLAQHRWRGGMVVGWQFSEVLAGLVSIRSFAANCYWSSRCLCWLSAGQSHCAVYKHRMQGRSEEVQCQAVCQGGGAGWWLDGNSPRFWREGNRSAHLPRIATGAAGVFAGSVQVKAIVLCTNTECRVVVKRYNVKLCAKVEGRGGGWMAILRGFGGRGIDPLICRELLLELQVSLLAQCRSKPLCCVQTQNAGSLQCQAVCQGGGAGWWLDGNSPRFWREGIDPLNCHELLLAAGVLSVSYKYWYTAVHIHSTACKCTVQFSLWNVLCGENYRSAMYG
ncbi:hypothetical protein J6590_028769 [Homalodisca vitripennis]|nr:hypothetical protein J6590_028769 [Homalodisca vitripennis]